MNTSLPLGHIYSLASTATCCSHLACMWNVMRGDVRSTRAVRLMLQWRQVELAHPLLRALGAVMSYHELRMFALL